MVAMRLGAIASCLLAFVQVVSGQAQNCPAELNCSGDSSEERYLIQQITNNACFVASKSYCPYSHRAKDLLSNHGAKCAVLELDQREDGRSLQSALASMTGRRTVPNVFIGGKNVGGADDTAALAAGGSLKLLLKKAGAI